MNPLNTNPLNGLEAVTDTFSGFAKTVNTVRNVMRSRLDKDKKDGSKNDDRNDSDHLETVSDNADDTGGNDDDDGNVQQTVPK